MFCQDFVFSRFPIYKTSWFNAKKIFKKKVGFLKRGCKIHSDLPLNFLNQHDCSLGSRKLRDSKLKLLSIENYE
jgi:hypothetical protein